MASAPRPRLTPEQYLAIERAAEFKSEFYDGEMYAMSGASLPHNRIARNLSSSLSNQIGDGPCEVLGSDMRVAIHGTEYVYPDLVIICGEPQLLDDEFDTLLNPQTIIEILSPSTESWDRGGKFTQYQQIDSLRHYVLVKQNTPAVEVYDRQTDNTWLRTDITWPDGVLILASIGVAVPLQDVYFKVFPTNRPA